MAAKGFVVDADATVTGGRENELDIVLPLTQYSGIIVTNAVPSANVVTGT